MISYIIILVTCVVSIFCFNHQEWLSKLIFNPVKVINDREYYRLFSHAFIHANWNHLIFNMLVLYFFGPHVQSFFHFYFGSKAILYFIILYMGGIIFSNLWALYSQKDNYNYNSLGASGAVSAVLFCFIFFAPWEMLYFFGLFPIPGIIFGVLYMVYSYVMLKKKSDHIAHDAHFLGAIFGFIFPFILKPSLLQQFINQIIP